MNMKKALIIVDLQRDFMPGGSLAVDGGDQLERGISNWITLNQPNLIVATQDWHPADHCSFKTNGGAWPVHCVENSIGAMIKATFFFDAIIQKGTDKDVDSYSAFWDNERKKETPLKNYLNVKGVTDVYVCGLALNFCVAYTALDSIDAGFKTTVIKNLCRGIDINPGDIDKSIAEMKNAGVVII